jgi:hypothetical protein
LQGGRPRACRQQWNALAEKDGHYGYLDRIDQTGVEHAPEKLAAAKKPDVLSRFLLQVGDRRGHLVCD